MIYISITSYFDKILSWFNLKTFCFMSKQVAFEGNDQSLRNINAQGRYPAAPATEISRFTSRSDDLRPPPASAQNLSTATPPAQASSNNASTVFNNKEFNNNSSFLSFENTNNVSFDREPIVDTDNTFSGTQSQNLSSFNENFFGDGVDEQELDKARRKRQLLIIGLYTYNTNHGGNIPQRQHDMVMELINAATYKSILSKRQVRIFIEKLIGRTYGQIGERYHLTDKIIGRVLYRTATGRYWGKDMKGGGETILSDLDMDKFIKIVHDRENDINCLSTCQAVKIALRLQHERAEKAYELLNMCKCPKLAGKVEVNLDMDPTWLQKMAKAHNLNIMPKSDLDTMRRIACDKTSIEDFFFKHSHLLQRDPRLIFNMDETSVSSKKNLRLLFRKEEFPCPNLIQYTII